MALPDVCVGGSYQGAGVVGGQGTGGASSGAAGGAAAMSGGMPFITVVSGSRKTLNVGLRTTVCDGDPVDLTGTDHVELLVKETQFTNEEYIHKTLTVVDGTAGLVALEFAPADLPYAGIWPASFMLKNADGETTDEFNAWFYVKRSLSSVYPENRPITMAEVRMTLRDVCPEFNTLLLDLEFSDEEIMLAITKPIDEWNDTPPDLYQYSYTTQTFPYRSYWLKSTCAYLLDSAAYAYARNTVPYQAGGISFDDKNKMQPYKALANELKAEWKEFVLLKKRELNMGLCFGQVGSKVFDGGPWRT